MADHKFITSDLFGHKNEDDLRSKQPLNSRNLSGRYAEFVVCAQLTKLGYYVVHVDTQGFDLLLEYEGKSYRINVKSTSQSYQGPFKHMVQWNIARHARTRENQYARKRFTEKDADLLALFYNPLETTVLFPIINPMPSVIRVPISFIRNAENLHQSLKSAIEKFNKNGGIYAS